MSWLRGAARNVRRSDLQERDHEDLGQPATAIAARRTAGLGRFDLEGGPDPKTDEQLNSYSGTIYAVTTKIADRFARVPTQLQQVEFVEDGQAEERFDLRDHPFLSLMGKGVGRKPNEEDSVYEFKRSHQLSLDLTGEAWWLVERNSLGVPARIRLLPANRMEIVFEEDTGDVAGYFFEPEGAGSSGHRIGAREGHFIPKLSFEELDRQQNWALPFVTFFRYPSPRGVEDPRGWSPVKAAAHAWDINRFEQIYKREFLKNGAHLGGVLQSEMALDRDQIKEYTQQFKELHQGAQKAGLPLVLPKMLSWETTEPTPRDQQWVETMELTRTEILEVYTTSESQLGKADVGNRATADAMEAMFARDVINPRLEAFEQKLEGDFLPIYPQPEPNVHLDVVHPNPVPRDREFELKREEHEIETGLRTRNEIRAEKGLEPYGDFGDRVGIDVSTILIDPHAEGGTPADPDPGGGGDEEDDDERWPWGTEDPEGRGRLPARLGGQRDPAHEREMNRLVQQAPVERVLTESEAQQLITAIFGEEEFSRMADQLRPILDRIIEREGQLAMELVEGSPTFDPRQVKIDYLRVAENRIKGIGKTTAEAVSQALQTGISEGEGVRAIAGRIRQTFQNAESWRTVAIARTETVGAHNFAREEAFAQANVRKKEWLATLDGNVRESHALAHGQVVLTKDLFSVGGVQLQFPGDPAGPAAEVVNCRCTVLPVQEQTAGPGRSAFSDEQVEAIWRQFAANVDVWTKRMRPVVRQEFRRQEEMVLEALAALEDVPPEAI